MYRSLLVLLLVSASFFTNAQTKTQVYYNDKEVKLSKDTLDKVLSTRAQFVQDSVTKMKRVYDVKNGVPSTEQISNQLKDSLYQNTKVGEKLSVVDSLIIASNLDHLQNLSSQVYSERAIKAIYDSLGIDKLPKLPGKEITEEDLLILVNDKFSSHPVLDKSDSVMKNIPSAGDLSKQRLVRSSLSELTPLTGQVMKSKYFEKLDSIRDVNLKAQGLELKEQAVSEFGKVTELKEELNFWDKSYFEGIIGIANVEQLFVQLSPAMGYHFLQDLSFGLGPVINIYEDKANKKKVATVGIRPFLKQEFFKRRAYLQAEYVMNPSVENIESSGISKHNALAGGGVLLPISKSIAVNFCVMHRFNNEGAEAIDNKSSWTFRIGVSSTKEKK